jgi:hypothetical protein
MSYKASLCFPTPPSPDGAEAPPPPPPPLRPAVLSQLQDVRRYKSSFIWGQLVGWFKQTVLDPAAPLSGDRRGTLSLPDPEACYGRYGPRDREGMLVAMLEVAGGVWPQGGVWQFSNKEGRAYGSPALDEAVARSRGLPGRLALVVAELRAAGGVAPAGATREGREWEAMFGE